MCKGVDTLLPCDVVEKSQVIPQEAKTSLAAMTRVAGAPELESCGKTLAGIELIESVARALLCTISRTQQTGQCNTMFDSVAIPAIPVSNYLRRLYRDFRCSDSAFVCALVILDRILEAKAEKPSQEIQLTAWNVHRLTLCCVMLAAKYNEDRVWCNSQYARIGGVEASELNKYERFLFRFLGFKLGVDPEEYQLYLRRLRAMSDVSVIVPEDPSVQVLAERSINEKRLVSHRSSSGAKPCFKGLIRGVSLLLRLLSTDDDDKQSGFRQRCSGSERVPSGGRQTGYSGRHVADGVNSGVSLMRNAYVSCP